jgi:hypothetical protein
MISIVYKPLLIISTPKINTTRNNTNKIQCQWVKIIINTINIKINIQITLTTMITRQYIIKVQTNKKYHQPNNKATKIIY